MSIKYFIQEIVLNLFHYKSQNLEDLALGDLMQKEKTGEDISKKRVLKKIRKYN